MGGHGALVIGMRNPDLFSSISAFAPICNPSNSPWGRDKAFKFYLGEDHKEQWAIYDATKLGETYHGPYRKVLVDQVSSFRFFEVEGIHKRLSTKF